MKLSDMFEKGIPLIPEQHCDFVAWYKDGTPRGADALGTIMLGAGVITLDMRDQFDAEHALDQIDSLQQSVAHPLTHQSVRMESVIVTLFENHHWSRARLVVWLKTIGQ